MNIKPEHYEQLAKLFHYPKADYKSTVALVKTFIEEKHPELLPTIEEFADFVDDASQEKIEEIYTRTFDVQAITTLDLGYVLFGDDYKRGELLANLSREHKEVNNNCGTELPDNLSNLLTLLPKMQNTEVRDELVERIILPSLHKVISEFDVETIKLKNKIYRKQHKTIIEQSKDYGRIYRKPLTVVYKILEKDFNCKPSFEIENNNNFTKSIKTEIEID